MLHKYLQRRGSVYYFRWRVPADLRPILGVTELKHSLRTMNRMQASIRAGRYIVVVNGIQRARDAFLMLELTFDEYVSELEKQWVGVCCMVSKKKKTIKTGLITAGGMSFDYGGDMEKELAAVARAREMGLISKTGEPKQPNKAAATDPLFSEVFEGFLAHKIDPKEAKKEQRIPLSEKEQKDRRRDFNKLIAVMGDVPISTVTPKTLKDAILTCANLPQMNRKAYKGVPIRELLEMEIPEEHRVAGKTAIEVRKTAQGIFRYAVDVAGLLDSSPATGLRFGKLGATCSYAEYTNVEVRMILDESFKEAVPWKKWLPMLAAYTGARRGELVQFRKQDIKFDQDSHRHYAMVTDEAGSIKTDNAKRQVPLHTALIDVGFLDFVDKVGEEKRLFGDLNPQTVTKWFMSLRDKLGIQQFNDHGNRKVFHSFRHGFITRSIYAGNGEVLVQQVAGHERSSLGMTDTYIKGNQPLKAVLDVVDRVSYD